MNRFMVVTVSQMAALLAFGGVSAAQSRVPANGYPAFAIGADVSWMNRIQNNRLHTYYKEADPTSETTTIPQMVSDYGLDAVRLRVWVNPNNEIALGGFVASVGETAVVSSSTHGYCSAEDMVDMAKVFAARGQRLMVCFHLSDTWADPARQYLPKAWGHCQTAADLATEVAKHITETLTPLRQAQVNVAWVQIGNETNTGMLKHPLPTGEDKKLLSLDYGCGIADNSPATVDNFVYVFGRAAHAAKTVYPEAKTVLHLADGNKWDNVNWTLSLLTSRGFSKEVCDYVGLSLYPCATDEKTAEWKRETDKALTTIDNIHRSYGYRTLLCEIGINNEWSESTTATSQQANIAQCNADCKAFCEYLFANLKVKESSCDGLFYWEPESDYVDNYHMGGCYDIEGNWKRTKVTPGPFWVVCRANSTFPDGGLTSVPTGLKLTQTQKPNARTRYNLNGARAIKPEKGILVESGEGNRHKLRLAR